MFEEEFLNKKVSERNSNWDIHLIMKGVLGKVVLVSMVTMLRLI